MTAPSGKPASVGFRNVRIYALNAGGVPAADAYVTGTPNPYEGIVITAAKALTITHPEARRITHFGDDFVFLIDRLPPTETISGELRTGKQDNAVDALVSGVKAYTVGEAAGLNVATDQQGFEALFGTMAYQQALEGNASLALYGSRVWRTLMFPKTWLILREQGMSEATLEPQYAVFPQNCSAHLWGLPYTLAIEGDLLGQIERWNVQYKPLVVAWKSASATPEEFKFLTAHQAVATTKIHVISRYTATTGVITDITGTATKATTGITPASIATDDVVTAFYEWN